MMSGILEILCMCHQFEQEACRQVKAGEMIQRKLYSLGRRGIGAHGRSEYQEMADLSIWWALKILRVAQKVPEGRRFY